MNKILVIGDSCTDVFVYGDCYRLNPEAPTPVLKESHQKQYEGMAANVVNNVKALGLDCDFITQYEKIIKTRYVDEKSNYILLRIDNDNFVEPLNNSNLSETIKKYDLVIVSDYDKGFLTHDTLDIIFDSAKISFIDTKKAIGNWIKKATFIKINEAEFKNPKNDADTILELKEQLIITIGEHGVVYKN
jgi:D-beta-D-heptose 7-phosphate kinase/D-beta-D-heptose 1-phosphate adenosyltransferase